MTVNKYVYQGDDGQTITATLTHLDGTPINLTDASSVDFVMSGPSGVLTSPAQITSPATAGVVKYPLTGDDVGTPGDYQFVFQVHYSGGTVTYPTGGAQTLRVLPDLSALGDPGFLTPAEVYAKVAQSATPSDITSALVKISIYLDRDFDDDEWMESLASRDLARLKLAVASEAAEINKANSGTVGILAGGLPSGVTSVSQGDVSISFGSSTSASDPFTSTLAPVTLRVLGKLSWRSPRTLRPLSMYERVDTVFTQETAFGQQPIVRPPQHESLLWD